MKNIIKVLAIISYSLTILALYIIKSTPPAAGYEISIYSAYPSVLWFFILASNACGILILIIEMLKNIKDSNLHFLGLYGLLFNNYVILLLPFFRGYPIYDRGDTLIHLGYIGDIISYNHFNEKDFYPMIHILATVTSSISQLDVKISIYMLTPIFQILYILSIFILANNISKNKSQCLLITAFGSLPLLPAYYVPELAAISFIPLVIHLFFSSWLSKSTISYSILVILLLIAVPFFHPVTGAFLIIILFGIQISFWGYKLIYKNNRKDLLFTSKKHLLNIIFIICMAWFAWFSTTSIFIRAIRRLIDFLFKINQSQSMRYFNLAHQANLSIYEFLDLFMKMLGQNVLYIIPCIILCILLLKRILSKRKIEFFQLFFSNIFILFVILTIISATSSLVLTYNRLLRYVIFNASILNGFGIYLYLEEAQPKARSIIFGMVIFLLIISQSFALFNLFPSPIIKMHNYQVTSSDFDGMNWFLSNRDESLSVNDIYVWPYNLATGLRGIAYQKANLQYHGAAYTLPPNHFGYLNYTMLGHEYSEDHYLLINKISEEFYVQVASDRPSLMRFTPQDFKRLLSDNSVHKLYSNGEFKSFYIIGMNKYLAEPI